MHAKYHASMQMSIHASKHSLGPMHFPVIQFVHIAICS